MSEPKGYTYAQAGVSIAAGNALVRAIGPLAKSTRRSGADAALGGFGGVFDLKAAGFTDPLLVAANDGVGTKLKLAIEHDHHDGVGVDLVAMCANDLIVQGAEPLFFLDYYASGKLVPETAERVIASIAEGCRQAGCALIGGETAEMPGMYADGDYDLAGFCVGIVEKDAVIDGKHTRPGDVIIGLPSSGPHSNGYSLIRKLIKTAKATPTTKIEGGLLYDALLAPTRIYVKPLLALAKAVPVRSFAHITGGGITENIPRVIPPGLEVLLSAKTWQQPPVFDWLQKVGSIPSVEMYRTFNCGIGMTVCVAAEHCDKAMKTLTEHGEQPTVIGEVRRGDGGVVIHK
jgi:phosphoribosylformylglycinamidine cyclo-ligase